MNKNFVEEMKEKLLTQKANLTVKHSEPLDIDPDGDETDEIQAKQILNLTNQLNTRDSLKLIQINSALGRIAENTYGQCQDCGEEIPNARLLANPYFLTCVSCAEDREREERNRKRS